MFMYTSTVKGTLFEIDLKKKLFTFYLTDKTTNQITICLYLIQFSQTTQTRMSFGYDNNFDEAFDFAFCTRYIRILRKNQVFIKVLKLISFNSNL